jgi:nitrite reductase/ring-hydroxylating ferredoxin subunit
MATRSGEARSVDLTAGIRAGLVKEGKPFAGHVGGESVLLVRHDSEVYAISGTCTNDGAPLKGGLIVDGEIRCPRHHGRFSIATGVVTAPPALTPLTRWHVEQNGDRLFPQQISAS